MIGDRPHVIKKRLSKTSHIENIFQEHFNATSAYFNLIKCSQDFNTFDFWLIEKKIHLHPPRPVELKVHFNRDPKCHDLIGCDYIKYLKLKSLAVDTKAYIFHVLANRTLVQDVTRPVTHYKTYVDRDGREILLGLIEAKDCPHVFNFGFLQLEKLEKLKTLLEKDSQQKNLDATDSGSQVL